MAGSVTTEAVWELLSAKLRGFLRSRVEDDQTAEDLLQETFLRIHRRLETLGDGERLAPWVFQIARNLVVDHYRARGRVRHLPESEAELKTAPSRSEYLNASKEVASWLPPTIDSLTPTTPAFTRATPCCWPGRTGSRPRWSS